ncbi:MAG: SirA family protein [Gammaproteobacteria bacterium]|jgi:tRNA 2-thiouridine synthesizing protein A|nr:SirA family protein [Gammaproteobacteria bacterium]
MKQADKVVDTSGLICPLPLLKAKEQLKQMQRGQVLEVICTDPSSIIDFKVFTEVSANKLLASHQQQDKYFFLIEKL